MPLSDNVFKIVLVAGGCFSLTVDGVEWTSNKASRAGIEPRTTRLCGIHCNHTGDKSLPMFYFLNCDLRCFEASFSASRKASFFYTHLFLYSHLSIGYCLANMVF